MKSILIAVLAKIRFENTQNYSTLCIESRSVDCNYWKAQNRSSVVFLNTAPLQLKNSRDGRFVFKQVDFSIKTTDLSVCGLKANCFDFITIDFVSHHYFDSITRCDQLFDDVLRFATENARIICFFDETHLKEEEESGGEIKKKIKKDVYVSLHENKYESECVFNGETLLKLAAEHKLTPIKRAYGFPMGNFISSLDCEKSFKHFDLANSMARGYLKGEQRSVFSGYRVIVFERGNASFIVK